DELALIWKDQREVSPAEVDCFAALLGEAAETIARRCGIATRTSNEVVSQTAPENGVRLAELENRVLVLEQTVALLLERMAQRAP
nr:hypothetical protein [Hyphomonadaceae bacterium]